MTVTLTRGTFPRLVTAIAVASFALQLNPARAQDGIRSVSVRPADGAPTDPNAGGWFFLELEPGKSGSTRAEITNVSGSELDVRLYVSDITFADDGTPSLVEGEQTDLGAWSSVDPASVSLPADQRAVATIEVVAPADAEPGDHVGVLVAESEGVGPQGLAIVQRVATRFYVTVPGAAERALEITDVSTRADSAIWTRRLDVQALVRNVGNIRLEPTVEIGGAIATGSSTLLARSVEPYAGAVDVPWYGGWVDIGVTARDGDVVDSTDDRTFVIPWLLVALALLFSAAVLHLARWLAERRRRTRALRETVTQLERLVNPPSGDVPRPDGVVTRDEGGVDGAGERTRKR